MPKCRICHQPIDKNGNDWCMPSVNYYYHIKCYNDWKATEPDPDELKLWIDRITSFLGQDLKVSYNYKKCENQITKYIKTNKYTAKGIFFALKYFYEVKHNSWEKSNDGIGIVPYIYEESCNYWTEQERKQRGFVQGIEQQLAERQKRKVIKVKRTETKKSKQKYSLDDIGGAEDG